MPARVHPRERFYFAVAAFFSLLVYLLLVVSIIGISYLLLGALFALLLNGLFSGHFRGNGVRVSTRQFPDIHETARRLSRGVGLEEVPDIYLLQAGGALNAFAMRFMGRGYVVLFSDVVELARRQGEQALAFVIAHELAHHERGHTGWKRLVIAPALWMPFIGSAYSRACEYTCDAYATDAVADGAVDGLLVLAAGKELYAEVDAEAFVLQAQEERGFWVRFAEMMSTHPTLPKRVRAVRNRIARMPERAGAAEAGLLPV